jgi:uncharacterized protein with FMN-binding domain
MRQPLIPKNLLFPQQLNLASFLLVAIVSWLPSSCCAQDLVEFLNGTTMECTILEIRKDAKEFDIESVVGKQKLKRTYPYSKVHAVTFKGKRFELTPKADESSSGGKNTKSRPAIRSKAEVLKLIEAKGSTPPEWYATTDLNVPDTLDLTWPEEPPTKGWNNQQNVGQYIWDIVNPNEHRWHSGIKLVHHCMSLHKDDGALLKRDMDKLATMYFTLLQDYPRAAFWFQKSGAKVTRPPGIHLAECYWRLGNKVMALDMMRGKPLPPNAVKLLGDMGEIEDALRVAEDYSKSQAAPEVFLSAGDALRSVGRLDEAIKYYQRVLASDLARNPDYDKRFDARAQHSIDAVRLFDKVEFSKLADGSYRAASTGYNGPVEIEATVAGGKLKSLIVVSHQEKQYYAALSDTPKQVIEKQSIREIDGTSGATITSQAIVNATAHALAQGAK